MKAEWKQGRKEGRKEDRKEGRKEGRKEARNDDKKRRDQGQENKLFRNTVIEDGRN